MQRIYLDSNIISQIKKPVKEPFISIANALEQLKYEISIPYSTAHLADLKKGYKEEEPNKTHTNKDLEFLSGLSKDLHLYCDVNQKRVMVVQKSAIAAFEPYKEKATLAQEALDFEKLFSGIGLESIGSSFIEMCKNIEVPLDLDTLPDDNPLKKTLKDIFQTTGKTTSMLHLMNGLAKFSDEIHTDPKKYIDLRNGFRNTLKLPSDISNWEDNTWDRLDKHMSSTVFNKSFSNIVKDAVIQQANSKEITFHDEFLQAYMNLDLVGFHPESLNKKNTFTNFFNDSQHAFFGMNCDFFVTSDANTYAKTNAVYEKYEIKTEVLTANEFLAKLIQQMTTIELYNTAPNGMKLDYLVLTRISNADGSGFDYVVQYIDTFDNKATTVGVFDLTLGYITFEKTKGLGIPHGAIKLLTQWIDDNLEK